ncbi:acyl-CoA thioesterase-1 [Mucilaginibacter gracilis]|uniref:Acyl-CoA thioesterase-1 n=1 Tax=Mucilaginibacter gracilis TaxID=423350 RepID=A0A495IU11_9SPHI|nr:arylesterase [Mucilaginibacter gracilis]RKR80023.1 acyl-CoA thioesterase-1 [Mucilaginibacter gracilis]
MKNILFFGDSLTAGYGLSDAVNQSFPALIQQKINIENLNYRILNAGVSGDTSVGGLSRIDYWLSQPIDIFVLELGINDVMRGITPQVTSKNLQAIITKVKTKYPQVKIALMGMEIPILMAAGFAEQFLAVYRELATINQTAFVPFFLKDVVGIRHLNLADRIHPTAEGYRIIADNVWPVLRGLMV